MNKQEKKAGIGQLFYTFFSIGCFAFGGFMSLIAVVNSVIVEQKKWLSSEKILDGITIANLLPGPMAVNVVSYVGYKIGGWKGALASFVGVILPSFVLIILFAINYEYISQSRWITEFLFGVYPVLAAIILHTFVKLSKKIVRQQIQWGLILVPATILLIAPISFHLSIIFMLMIAYGILGGYLYTGEVTQKINTQQLLKSGKYLLIFFAFILFLAGISLTNPSSINLKLFSSFGSLSVMLFGGGYVFIPMLEDLVVHQNHWVSQKEFIDSIAIGQVTPGPIVITVSYIGYKAGGLIGAILSTIAIFGIPATLMIQVGNIFHLIAANEKYQSVIKYLRFCGIGLILYAGIFLILKNYQILPDHYTLRTVISIILLGISFLALRKWNTNIFLLILLGGVAQIIFYTIILATR